MISIVDNNRAALIDPVGTRVVRVILLIRIEFMLTVLQWSGWIIQQYNSASVAMGALGKEL